MAQVARRLGVVDPPETTAGLAARLAEYRPELRATAESRAAARYLLSTLPAAVAGASCPTPSWRPRP
ncbi:hypothetical protein STANM309S_03505 [Streptomyces tanashiensis]